MISFFNKKKPDDLEKKESSTIDDDGSDETTPEETLFLDMSEALNDECAKEETIVFDEVYGSAVPGSDVEKAVSYDPFIRYAYVRKINGNDFVEKRRISRRQSIYGIAFVILLAATSALGFGIYHLVNHVEKNDDVAAEISKQVLDNESTRQSVEDDNEQAIETVALGVSQKKKGYEAVKANKAHEEFGV